MSPLISTPNNRLKQHDSEATPFSPMTPLPLDTSHGEDGDKHKNYEEFSSPSPANNLYQSHSVPSVPPFVTTPDKRFLALPPPRPRLESQSKSSAADSTTASPHFRDDVRNEWIDAMFGPAFFPVGSSPAENGLPPLPPRQGVGLSGIRGFLTHTCSIPPVTPDGDNCTNDGKNNSNNSTNNVKVGITLSRIPLGVYVRVVDFEGEAFAAGIHPGSVLIEVNGMGVLGEPSHKLLERLWKYEGHFDGKSRKRGFKSGLELEMEPGSGEGGAEGTSLPPSLSSPSRLVPPVVMKFQRKSKVYSVPLFNPPPFGISWAPCANFALVQRSHSRAAAAGVRRGCIVAAVGNRNFRTMDHLDTAMELKCWGASENALRITCVYTPAASRTGYFERGLGELEGGGMRVGGGGAGKDWKSTNGVRVRTARAKRAPQGGKIAPEAYMGSFFNCGINQSKNTGGGGGVSGLLGGLGKVGVIASKTGTTSFNATTNVLADEVVAALAGRVAAGEIPAPTGRRRSRPIGNAKVESSPPDDLQSSSHGKLTTMEKTQLMIPTSEPSDLLQEWDVMDALLLCLRMHVMEYDIEKFSLSGGVIGPVAGSSGLFDGVHAVDTEVLMDTGGRLEELRRIAEFEAKGDNANDRNESWNSGCAGGDTFQPYLIQAFNIIGSRVLYAGIVDGVRNEEELKNGKDSENDSSATEKEKKKIEDMAVKKMERVCCEMVDILLHMVRFFLKVSLGISV